MELALVVSIIAALISLGSLAVTIWATRISKQSLNHAINIQERMDSKEFERTRSDILIQIADCRKVLDKTRIEIGALKTNFDAEPQPVQLILSPQGGLFSDYLPKVEGAIRLLDALKNDVLEWTTDKPYGELMNAKAVLYQQLKDNEVVYDAGIYSVNEFKTKLELAKEYVKGSASERTL